MPKHTLHTCTATWVYYRWCRSNGKPFATLCKIWPTRD